MASFSLSVLKGFLGSTSIAVLSSAFSVAERRLGAARGQLKLELKTGAGRGLASAFDAEFCAELEFAGVHLAVVGFVVEAGEVEDAVED